MSATRVRWAHVEYQLDLRSTQPRVPLGVVVLARYADGVRALIAGRAPRPGSPPPHELGSVGPLGRSQLDGWVAAMAKDVLAALEKREDSLEALVATWCWNLSVTIADDVEAPPGDTLRDVAARLYARHLGTALPPGAMAPLARGERPHAGDWSVTEATYAAA
jgi:hypothetical protein